MNPRRLVCLGMLIVLILLPSCGSQQGTPEPTSLSPTASPQVPVGFTEEGMPYRGNPDAPVTLYEHSEFQ